MYVIPTSETLIVYHLTSGITARLLIALKMELVVAVSSFMGYLKGKSSLMIYEQFGDMKFKYRNREFWCRGYYVDTVGKKR